MLNSRIRTGWFLSLLLLAGLASASVPSWLSPAAAAAARRSSVIVGVHASAMDSVRAAVESKGGFVKKRYSWNAYLVSVPSGESATSFSRAVRAVRGVRYVEGNATMHAAGTANDPLFPKQWGTRAIGVPAAWDSSEGSGVAIAVLDTGIDWTHEDLAGTDIVHYRNYVTPGTAPIDDEDHGTHVSGVLAAVRNNLIDVAGTAPHATLYACKVLDNTGAGDLATISNALRDVADHTPCKIFSMSFGIAGVDLTNAQSVTVKEAIAHVQSKGVLCVAATGNDGRTGVFYPASVSGVIGVGAVDQDLNVAPFSNYGAALVDLAAPGVGIISTIRGDGTATWDGTSMATPFVSASAALVWSRYPSLDASAVAGLLMRTAQDLGSQGVDALYGHGLVRPDLALASPPITTLRVSPSSPDGTNGWYLSPPAVTLTADDPRASTQFKWDGDPWSVYSAPVRPTEGTHTLSYYSVGDNGQTEAVHVQAFKVDSGAPVTTIAGLPASGVASAPIAFSLSSTDPDDGVAHIYYSLDGGATTLYSSPVRVLSVGQHEVRYWATDTAGNAEAKQVATFTVTAGATVPVTTATTIASNVASPKVRKAFTLSGALTSGHAGDRCILSIKKAGAVTWSYLATRTMTGTSGARALWSLRYTPKLRGTYYFRARFAGDAARLPSVSRALKVRIR